MCHFITGCHANYIEDCEMFINDPSYLVVSSDVSYLGQGMYFWNHQSNAQYWQVAKKADAPSGIVSAEINTDAMLDITDDDVCKLLAECIAKLDTSSRRVLRNKYGGSIRLGKNIDYLFDSFPILQKYTVVKGREYKSTKREATFLIDTKLSTKSVDIYCVRIAAVAVERKWVRK